MLRFTIRRDTWGTGYAWLAIGTLPDEDDDTLWGNFVSWGAALRFVNAVLANGGQR